MSRKRIYLLVNNQVVSAALWELVNEKGIRQNALAAQLGVHTTTIQYALSGKTRLEVNRLYRICTAVGITEQQVYDVRDAMVKQVANELGNATLLAEFPNNLTKNQTILRTFDLNHRRMGNPWIDVLATEGISSDDIMRARSILGWSRQKTAEAFGLTHGAIEHWERVSFPHHRTIDAKRVFASVFAKEQTPLRVVEGSRKAVSA